MLNERKVHQRQIILFLVVVLMLVGSVMFAEGELNAKLESVSTQLLNFFQGPAAKAIVGACFAGSCIAYAYNKDNEKMKSKVMAVMIASGLLAMAQTGVDFAFNTFKS